MKTRFYCVMSEFYDNGAVKAAIASRESKAIPENTERKLPGMTAANTWFVSMEDAERRLNEVRAA